MAAGQKRKQKDQLIRLTTLIRIVSHAQRDTLRYGEILSALFLFKCVSLMNIRL
jgi:hypothetical protein